jgi:transketolase
MRNACLRMVRELAKQDERIVFIGSDLGAGVFREWHEAEPERCRMEGICEQAIVGIATGMALSGKIVYIHTIANFFTRRAFEQVCLDVGLHQANVRLIGAGGGAVYAPLGPTHLATDDIALMRTIPGMTILAPCDAVEMERLMPETVEHTGPVYIRLGRGGDPIVTDPKWTAQIGSYQVMRRRKGSNYQDVVLISTGTASQIALEAASMLADDDVDVEVIHCPSFPLPAFLRHHTDKARAMVITIEDHGITGGLGSAVAEIMAESPHRMRDTVLKRIGYPDVFPHGYGTQDEMRARYGLTAEAIVAQVRSTWVHS